MSASASHVWISELPRRVDQTVVLRGWVEQRRSSGKITED
jgi:aspartyl/asparaginyl-tRNA synthetase